jgi:hypothetical protein
VSATLFIYAHDEEFFKEMYNNLIHAIHVLMQVGVGDPLAGDQGQLHDETHHIPSQYKVRSVLMKPVHTMSFVESTLLNTESTKVSPAVQHHSALLNNGEKQEVLISLLWTILLKILLLHKDSVEIIC